MQRYHGFARYLAFLLIVLYILAGGHLFCAHFYCSHAGHCHHSVPENQDQSARCCHDVPCDHDCKNNTQPARTLSRGSGEMTKLFSVPFFGFASLISEEDQPGQICLRDVGAIGFSASSLRSHLLYRSLLI